MHSTNFPFKLLTICVMLTSSLMAISSTNWIFLWLALELNLLSFIPLLMQTKSFQETEASVKYFLAQAIGSSVLLMSSMSLWSFNNSPNNLMFMLLIMSLFIKTGMAPCHMWYPSVMMAISWMSAMILSTWQKLAPLFIMAFMLPKSSSNSLMILAGLNALLGGVMGLNQSHMRVIMAYSSITHMGWMLSLISLMMSYSVILYFMIYSSIIIFIFLIFNSNNMTTSSDHSKLNTNSISFYMPILLLSLSGIPPFTGFIPKWLTINLIAHTHPILVTVLIMGSMLSTYFYLNIMFNLILSYKPLLNQIQKSSIFIYYKNLSIKTLLMIPLMGLVFMPIFFI